MTCTHPIRLHDPERLVPCGKCYNCLANVRAQWTYRLNCEVLASRFALFVTLTYSDENLPFRVLGVNTETGEDMINFIRKEQQSSINYKVFSAVNSVYKRDVQLFFKRLRKSLGDESFRYFLTSEYGDLTLRPHYHVIFFFQKDFDRKTLYDTIESTWALGNVHFGECETASIAYCTKYCLKETETPLGAEKPFRLMSKRPALGDIGYQSYIQNVDNTGYYRAVTHGVGSAAAPRLWRDKYIKSLGDDSQKSIKEILQNYAEQQKYLRYQKWAKLNPDATMADYEYFCLLKSDYRALLAAKRRTKTKL